MAGTSRPTALYRMFDGEGALLYVGISSDLQGRWTEHSAGPGWFLEVTRASVIWFSTRAEAFESEAAAIKMERPRHNQKLNPANVQRIPPPLDQPLKKQSERQIPERKAILVQLMKDLGVCA